EIERLRAELDKTRLALERAEKTIREMRYHSAIGQAQAQWLDREQLERWILEFQRKRNQDPNQARKLDAQALADALAEARNKQSGPPQTKSDAEELYLRALEALQALQKKQAEPPKDKSPDLRDLYLRLLSEYFQELQKKQPERSKNPDGQEALLRDLFNR